MRFFEMVKFVGNVAVNAVNLEDVLGDIQTDHDNLQQGRSSSVTRTAILWHTDAAGGGRPPHQVTMFTTNADVLEGWRSLATLDARTSLICGGLDQQVFALDDPTAPFPPRHTNCRSVAVPVVPGMDKLSPRTRAAADGPVEGDTAFEAFLRSQDEAFQVEVLGPARLAAWRRGVPLGGMATYERALSLEELRAIYPGKVDA